MNNDFMLEAIKLAAQGMKERGAGPFGALIVKAGKIVGRGINQVTSTCDPTAHAEISAIRDACKTLKTFKLDDCEIYTTCEPCPMCLGAIYWSRLQKIYYAAEQEDAAKYGFDDQLFYEEIKKPLNSRKIHMIQVFQKDALELFKTWDQLPGKVSY